MSGFRILNAGIFATIQDRGRYGYTHLGVCHSGAMDEYAYLWGQMLLNNHTQNSIELMTGLKLQATAPIQIAITGANLSFKINGIYLSNYSGATYCTIRIEYRDKTTRNHIVNFLLCRINSRRSFSCWYNSVVIGNFFIIKNLFRFSYWASSKRFCKPTIMS